MSGEHGYERVQVVGWRQGVGVQADDEIVSAGLHADRIHQFLACVANSSLIRRPAPTSGCAVDDADVEVRDVSEKPEADLVRLANSASVWVVLPDLRLVDAKPRDESHAVLHPQRVDTAAQVFDLVLDRDGYVDGGLVLFAHKYIRTQDSRSIHPRLTE